jgi:DNA topoisomerase-3
MPEDIDKKKYGYWRLETLPIIPEKFGLKPIPSSRERFASLKKLLARKDISEVINACDAGREGELIFTYICQLANVSKKLPVKRAWMQTMTADGIRAAFARLRDGSEMAGLADAARCRSESDWLVGINGTRAVTRRMFGSRGGNVASVGRVQTPTLAIVFARELEIRNFTPRDYWRLSARFKITNGDYEGIYQVPNFKKSDADDQLKPERLWDKQAAEAILADCLAAKTAEVRDDKKAATQIAPRLYDLTTLQREANTRFGLPARRTLQIAQALYERHKVLTYPRTDSRALPEDYIPTCKETLGKLSGTLAQHARKALDNNWIRPNKRIFNNAQISDHFAIIPTGADASKLDDMEAKIYDMVARRFVAVFHPAAEFDVTTRSTTIASKHTFKSEGKVLTNAGWLAVYGKTTIEDDSSENRKSETANRKSTSLPALAPADKSAAKVLGATLLSETTKPPPRYTEATLLSAMEGAGKLVDDEDLAQAMKERGLGTPATRAETIEGLVNQKYIDRDGKDLVPTAKAGQLLEFLSAIKADALTKPDMTGEWEFKLRQMEHGKFPRPRFMEEIVDATKGLVERTKNFEEHHDDNTTATTIPSPTDNLPLVETLRAYRSQDGRLTIFKTISGRKIEEPEVRQLVANNEIGPLDGFVSARNGRRFTAKLRLAPDPKKAENLIAKLDFGDAEDLAALEPVWTDPNTGEQLVESDTRYILRKREKGDAEWQRVFSAGKILCKRTITRAEIIKILSEGKSGLITDFTSKFGRPFKAYLTRAKNRLAFEFPPREPKAGGAASARKPKPVFNPKTAKQIGTSPSHNNLPLFETKDAYVVADLEGSNEPRVLFEIKREICKKEIPAEEVKRLLTDGKTNMMEGFIGKSGRPFTAGFVLSKTGKKADFDFPPR